MSEPSAPRGSGAGAAKLWGGRFRSAVDPQVDRYTRSFPFDRRLAQDDLVGCLAHGRMLWERGVLEDGAARQILTGLAQMLDELHRDVLQPEGDDEDVHSWIERVLTERVGTAARRLHTGRSRNDQTAVALRLYLRREQLRLLERQLELLLVWLGQAAEHRESLLPGYTHLQRGQPTSLAHHLLAHAWLVEADARRTRRAHRVAGCSPLGAAALAGTPHPIDPERSAALLGFEEVFPNSMYAVADRDYVLETSFACALAMVHLSRWAEELILWSSSEFGFVRLDDSIAKGSSIMPQKKNPEPLEILRSLTGRVIGDLVAHLVQLKGLPLTYNSDLQEDKEALFDALDTTEASFGVAAVAARGVRFDLPRMAAALHGGYVTATDLADVLVRRGLAFRDAHEQTGAAVRLAEDRGCELWELPFEALHEVCPELQPGDLESLAPAASLSAHASAGGPAPERVAQQQERLVERVGALERWRAARAEPPILLALRAGRLLDLDWDPVQESTQDSLAGSETPPDRSQR